MAASSPAQKAEIRQSKARKSSPSKAAVKAALSLKQRGWASIEGVLKREECKEYEDSFWNWMEGLETGVKRDDPKTWEYPNWPPSFRGIINSLEVAHQAFVWKVRKHPRVTEIFAELWGSDALLSSFDSINALPGTENPPAESWLHVDQAPHRRGAACIQGLVNLVDVGPDSTGTLLVKDRSHAAHQIFFEKFSKMSEEEQRNCIDHYKFLPEELSYWEPYESVGVQGGAGSLFLWDSRAVHANVFPSATTAMRHVVYTCYQPVSMASEQDLQQKQEAYKQFRLTTHWPAMNIRLYDDASAVEYYGAEANGNRPQYQIKRTRDEVEDRKLLQLAGMTPYSPEEAHVRPALIDYTEKELQDLLS